MPQSLELSEKDVELLNTKLGLRYLLANPKVDVAEALKLTRHENDMEDLHVELINLQQWMLRSGKRAVIIFEGRDAAGKGGAIRRLTAHINPRHFNTFALPKPTEEERGQWYFQRYVSCLPNAGEISFFDRSWYNRAMVEPVNGFCTQEEYDRFMGEVNAFEKMLVDSGIYLIKFYFSITRKEQAKRFKMVSKSALKKWQLSPVDENAQALWSKYTEYKNKMLKHTDTTHAPWVVIDANESTSAHQTALRHILETIPYEHEEPPE